MSRFAGRRTDGTPKSEADEYEVCQLCGQAFDKRIGLQVLWHEIPDHKPLAEGRQLIRDEVIPLLPQDLFDALYGPPERRAKARSVYRGINIADLKGRA